MVTFKIKSTFKKQKINGKYSETDLNSDHQVVMYQICSLYKSRQECPYKIDKDKFNLFLLYLKNFP